MPLTRILKPHRFGSMLAGDMGVSNARDYSYLIKINVGGQTLPVLLDTGSADLWIATEDCAAADCRDITKYNKSSSTSLSTSNTPFHLKYLVGSVSGIVAQETVTIGEYEVHNQIIALANDTSALDLQGMGASGILGLSFTLAASIPQESGRTLLENLFLQFPEQTRYFTFKLGRQTARSLKAADDPSSSFTIGELDPDLAPDMTHFTSFFNVYSSFPNSGVYDYWKLPLVGLTINSTQAFQLSPSSVRGSPTPIAILDTGTTLILGPTKDVEAFWGTVGSARFDPLSNMWQVRCDRAAQVNFIFGEGDGGLTMSVPLDPIDVNWRVNSGIDGWCQGGLQPNAHVNSGDWLLGDVFLRNVYTVHQFGSKERPPRIGFMSTTNSSDALVSFRVARGPDLGAPPGTLKPVGSAISRTAPSLSATGVYSLSGGIGFTVGALLVTGFRIKKSSRYH